MVDEVFAIKAAFDSVRSILAIIKETKDVLPDASKKEALDLTIEQSKSQLLIAESQIAQSLGYPLCRCQFPPTPMLKVGYRTPYGTREPKDVHECPKCKQTDAGNNTFSRMVD
ncbi:hypothetical protein HED22_05790 [Thalassospira sp. HF15]|uniref:hypothetical protein n=1 Tax=Thalassospira sp. HF15 TaxID=2722755 RepID=UPI001430CA2B|nr:hypothetical protein [Thalassospira sp. HF15]NIY75150.1 hypothetical protein [Thalassospira sp. HF15]